MPLLTPSSPPPKACTSSAGSIAGGSGAKRGRAAVPPDVAPGGAQDARYEVEEKRYEEKCEEREKAPSTVSRITLDVDDISAELAGHLAATLVGHVLFLKNQVPFPVMQLYRIPGGKSTPRALKQRTELLDAVDTLSSHLGTTFSALSTALARGAKGARTRRARAYLAVLVGPSIGSAKTRVMFAVDGLVVRVWGEREESDDDESEEQSDADSDTDSSTGSHFAADADASSPPPSRSPSPCTSPVPSIPSIPPLPIPPPSKGKAPPPQSTQQTLRAADRLLAHTLATAEHSMAAELAPTQTHILLRAPRRFAHPAWVPRRAAGALEGAVRAMRAMRGEVFGVGAGARNGGQGDGGRGEGRFREETRAYSPPGTGAGDTPRNGLNNPRTQTQTKKTNGIKNKKTKVEGAWVTCRCPGVDSDSEDDGDGVDAINGYGVEPDNGVGVDAINGGPEKGKNGRAGAGKRDGPEKGKREGEEGKKEEDEEDEMIWWSWDGKIVGFADW
ncbi:hypothetical protein C8R47DRAFT_1201498 [Mycena vitilis]|nr:hypothetical protein C8R47DRAFT_1201498 [Mycena vitilis]